MSVPFSSAPQISRNLGKMYSEMIFLNGFVHCDPHPGNVLVRKCPRSNKTEIVLLDHGLYQVRHRPSLGAHNKANPSHITGHYSPAASLLSELPVMRRRKSISLETTCSSAMCFRTALLHTRTHAHARMLARLLMATERRSLSISHPRAACVWEL